MGGHFNVYPESSNSLPFPSLLLCSDYCLLTGLSASSCAPGTPPSPNNLVCFHPTARAILYSKLFHATLCSQLHKAPHVRGPAASLMFCSLSLTLLWKSLLWVLNPRHPKISCIHGSLANQKCWLCVELTYFFFLKQLLKDHQALSSLSLHF